MPWENGAVVPSDAERRVLEDLLTAYSLEGVLLALMWIYQDRAQRFGGAAGEAQREAAALVEQLVAAVAVAAKAGL